MRKKYILCQLQNVLGANDVRLKYVSELYFFFKFRLLLKGVNVTNCQVLNGSFSVHLYKRNNIVF